MKKYLILLLAMISLAACTGKGPHPILYGEDACEYCRMGIVQPQYGAELITSKGKVFKFDAVECMINYQQEHKETSFPQVYVVDFTQAQTLVPAHNAYFLHSKKLASPMGMFLTATEALHSAQKLEGEHGGKVYNWQQLNEKFENLSGLLSAYE